MASVIPYLATMKVAMSSELLRPFLVSACALSLTCAITACDNARTHDDPRLISANEASSLSSKESLERPPLCASGFALAESKDCVDVDECLGTPSPCHRDALCVNTPGSFSCACQSGYLGDGLTCEPFDEKIKRQVLPLRHTLARESALPGRSDAAQSALLCRLSGMKGERVECALRVARESAEHLPATGANLRLTWADSPLAFEQVLDAYCLGETCWSFDTLVCEAGGVACAAQPLQSGHSLLLVPQDIAEVSDWLSITLVHPASVDLPLTSALVDPEGAAPPEATLLTLRFRLLEDVSATTPVEVSIENASFDRVDRPLSASLYPLDPEALIVTGGAQ